MPDLNDPAAFSSFSRAQLIAAIQVWIDRYDTTEARRIEAAENVRGLKAVLRDMLLAYAPTEPRTIWRDKIGAACNAEILLKRLEAQHV